MLRAILPLGLASVANAIAYDFVIVGAGTSGLVIANRLSELNVTVAVIEAGDSQLDNSDVYSANGYGLAFGSAIDWAYKTVNQTYAGNTAQTIRAGKAIGGTSTINGMAYTRAEDIQIDAWEALGNEGWNWNALLPYYLKSQNFTAPTEVEIEDGASYSPAVNGYKGPLKTGFKANMSAGVHALLGETYANLGLPSNPDVNSGSMRGYNLYPSTVDTDLNIREDAGRAYYYPIQGRKNLHLYPNTVAQRMIWSSNSTVPTASGVQVLPVNSSSPYTITANREVILSAGALASPLLLELSGVGNPTILKQHNISVVVDLPTVGENLQDQMNNEVLFSTANSTTFVSPSYVAYPTAADVFGSSHANVSATILSQLPAYAQKVAAASGNVTEAADLLSMFKIQHELIFSTNHSVPIAEILITASSQFAVEYWALLPFARGNVHISSSVPGASSKLNPNYFMLEWDRTGQAGVANYIRSIFSTAPFSTLVGNETAPGLATVPATATEDVWMTYLLKGYRSNFHPVGTTAMMPKDIGGVVDTKSKVYGTANVRVVDAGVLPFQVCGHLVSTLYAVAEKTADLIKSEL